MATLQEIAAVTAGTAAGTEAYFVALYESGLYDEREMRRARDYLEVTVTDRQRGGYNDRLRAERSALRYVLARRVSAAPTDRPEGGTA